MTVQDEKVENVYSAHKELEEDPEVIKPQSIFMRIFYAGTFFIFGIANLLAWTAFLTNIGISVTESEKLNKIFESWFFMFSTIFGLAGNFLNLVIVNRVRHDILVISTFAFCLAGFVYTASVVRISTTGCSPIMITGLYKDAGYIGFIYFIFLNAGQSFSGLLLAIIKLFLIKCTVGINSFLVPITKTVADMVITDEDKTAFLYFSITIGMIIISSVLYIVIINMKWIDGFTIYLSMTITLFIFPVLLLKLESTSSNLEWIFNTFFAFALGDFISRYIYMFLKWPRPGTIWMIIFASMRVLFLFLFFCCKNQLKTGFPMIFNHDVFPILFVFLFGLTGGHLITIVFSVPYSLETIEKQVDCSSLFVLLLGFGLASGSLLSWVF
ncbi:hypothetical protein MXB_2269 [Myxobolus squamalis]|nr:hypothetical protein MXB_2269 [Myxobolus squamalis]